MKKYRGFRFGNRPVVFVEEPERPEWELLPHHSQQVYNHSPDGFEWGYGGSGPAQLALAILLDHTRKRELAFELHQDFKFAFLAPAAREGFEINSQEIDDWQRERDRANGDESTGADSGAASPT